MVFVFYVKKKLLKNIPISFRCWCGLLLNQQMFTKIVRVKARDSFRLTDSCDSCNQLLDTLNDMIQSHLHGTLLIFLQILSFWIFIYRLRYFTNGISLVKCLKLSRSLTMGPNVISQVLNPIQKKKSRFNVISYFKLLKTLTYYTCNIVLAQDLHIQDVRDKALQR